MRIGGSFLVRVPNPGVTTFSASFGGTVGASVAEFFSHEINVLVLN